MLLITNQLFIYLSSEEKKAREYDNLIRQANRLSSVTPTARQIAELIKQEAFQEYYVDLLRKQIDVEMLKHQIQPHFLYNTLDSIRGQAILENAHDVADALKALSQYFHYNVQQTDDFVCVANEIQNIKDYFFIQHFRFGSRYQIKWDYDLNDLSILNTPIPKFTLQPIIENSLVHGFSNVLDQECIITIKIEAYEHVLILKCSDNGSGMSPETLQKILAQLNTSQSRSSAIESSSPQHGIALNNVHQRIKLIFGEQYGLQICSVKDFGTDVYIRLPFNEK